MKWTISYTQLKTRKKLPCVSWEHTFYHWDEQYKVIAWRKLMWSYAYLDCKTG